MCSFGEVGAPGPCREVTARERSCARGQAALRTGHVAGRRGIEFLSHMSGDKHEKSVGLASFSSQYQDKRPVVLCR